MDKRHEQLRIAIEEGVLVIRVGVDLLAHAINHAPYPVLRVTDADRFMPELVRALKYEEEDGTTAVHRLFDKAAITAFENGAEGCEEHA